MKKKIIVLAMVFTILPFNLLIKDKYDVQGMGISYYIAIVIGYILFFINFRNYTKKQKKILIIALIICILHFFSVGLQGILDLNINHCNTGTMSDLGPYIISGIIFYFTYFINRILCLILGVSILRNHLKSSNK